MDWKKLLIMLIEAIPDEVIPELQDLADDLLDVIEDRYSDNELLMAIVGKVRSGMSIPDDAGEDSN